MSTVLATSMTKLIDKMERRLGTRLLNLPPHLQKTEWGTVIEKDTLDVDKNCPFIAGDVLLCQTASGLTAKRYYAYVSYSTNKYIAIKSNHLRNNVIY